MQRELVEEGHKTLKNNLFACHFECATRKALLGKHGCCQLALHHQEL